MLFAFNFEAGASSNQQNQQSFQPPHTANTRQQSSSTMSDFELTNACAFGSHSVTGGTAGLLGLGLGLMDTPHPPITPPPRPLSAPSALFPLHLRGRERQQPGSPLTATACTLDQSESTSKSHQSFIASRLKRSISTGSEISAKRVSTDAADSQSSPKPISTTQRVLSHKKSDQRRREALRSSFNRLQSVIPQPSPTASPASSGVPGSAVPPASSTSPPPLLNDDNDDDDDGGKGLNRVETMQATIRYIHSLRDRNVAMDGKIAALQAELMKLKQRQQILPS
ncbi:hypothetical protein BJ741DRAFT_612056 [Chytriomyces cf. hyalinus JEL632]|nr:hypothetical protein BJ741DRAFT_612056 [Chytriomyces cf. hyalinus JEL632]